MPHPHGAARHPFIVPHPRGGRAIHMMETPVAIARWGAAWPELPPQCVPDTSNPHAVAVANGIALHDTPVRWREGGEYAAVIDAQFYLFVMWTDQGRRLVSVYRCDPAHARGLERVVPSPGPGQMGTPYSATAECPCPPSDQGWRLVDATMQEAQNQTFYARAEELMSELPCWAFRDEVLGGSLYRWFKFENACGSSCGALKYVGMMGDNPIMPEEPEGGEVDPISEDNPKGPGGAPIPQPDATCGRWEPTIEGNITDEKTPTGMANAISYHNRPTPWKDQTFYRKTIGGTRWTFVMYSAGGRRMVSTFKCVEPKTAPPKAMISSSAFWIVLALVAAALTAGGVAYAHQKKHDRRAA